MWRAMVGLLAVIAATATAAAQTIYPLDRAEILAGARFDFKVELPGAVDLKDVRVTVNGAEPQTVLGNAIEIVQREEGQAHTAMWIRDASLTAAGTYTVVAEAGTGRAEVKWEVFDTAPAKARNVILFIGDGMSNAHRVAARILSKGMRQGRYGGELAMDAMAHMALVSTAGSDSIITDSANSAAAYTTGHKTCVNALGVYCAKNVRSTAHPRFEAIASLARRLQGKAIGIVTNTEINDATPAAMFAHTRRRGDYDAIVQMLFEARPEVVLGGGSRRFLPPPNGQRRDNVDYLRKFEDAGYAMVATAPAMLAAARRPATRHLFGLFNSGEIDGALDRRILKKGSVGRFPEQPDLVEQLEAALEVLGRNERGFVLMVESGMIDKYSHALDWERAVYDTIMLDNAVAKAKAWARDRGDTLIMVVADHTHPVAIIGTYDDARPGTGLRDKLAVYNEAGFPNYPPAGTDGYPASVDVSRRLGFVFSAFPDHCDAGRPFLGNPNRPGNAAVCQLPGAARRAGNLPAMMTGGVHSGEDVVVTAMGPGAEAVHGRIDNTRIFRVMAAALGLGAPGQGK